jgi:hypothetical protein
LTSLTWRVSAIGFCIKAFSETDFTEDLKAFDVQTLILHGDDDQIVPQASDDDRDFISVLMFELIVLWEDPFLRGMLRDLSSLKTLTPLNRLWD